MGGSRALTRRCSSSKTTPLTFFTAEKAVRVSQCRTREVGARLEHFGALSSLPQIRTHPLVVLSRARFERSVRLAQVEPRLAGDVPRGYGGRATR